MFKALGAVSTWWQGLVREMGAPMAALYTLHRLLGKLSGGRARIVPYAIYAQPLGSAALSSVRDDPATVTMRCLTGDSSTNDFPRPGPVIAARFAAGAECYATLVKGQFAGHIWIARNRYDEDEVRCEYVLSDAKRCVWDFDVYVAPAYRLGRALARMWKAVDANLRIDGVAWSFSRISLFNRGSISTHERLGAVRTGHAIFVVIGSAQLALLSASPFVHASLGDPRRPTILLREPPTNAAQGKQLPD